MALSDHWWAWTKDEATKERRLSDSPSCFVRMTSLVRRGSQSRQLAQLVQTLV
jgi:hypothetical protein